MADPSSQHPEPVDRLALQLRGGLEAAATARRALVDADGAIAPELREDVLLLMTELITNAVRHGSAGPEQTLGVDVRWSPRWVRVEVTDPSTESRPRVTASLDQYRSRGWGLFLVEQIAATTGPVR
jgi:anti-sigma regulatory factor (Ser/Thr protein kinase)